MEHEFTKEDVLIFSVIIFTGVSLAIGIGFFVFSAGTWFAQANMVQQKIVSPLPEGK